jgi:UDP-glucose 4-epimerase
MDILITGAGGRIGSRLARMLVDDGHQVRGFGVPGDPGLAVLAASTDVEVFEGDLTDRPSLVDAVSGVDAICHLAAALTTHEVEDDAFVAVNLGGTYNLLSTAKEHAPAISRFVYTSSDAVYWPALTNRPLYLPIDESHPLLAGSVYGATKVGAEAMCGAFWRSYGIPFVVMRPTATASPHELVDPASPFGRRWFVSSAIARLERLAGPVPGRRHTSRPAEGGRRRDAEIVRSDHRLR